MRKRLTQKGTQTILPIVGDSVVSLTVSNARYPEIVVTDDVANSLQLNSRIALQ